MPGDIFSFKKFNLKQDKCAMKVGTDAVLLGAWAELPAKGCILDIGTGTGIIALMSAQRSGTFIDAIEIDEPAYKEAYDNCYNSTWKDRIQVHHISLQSFAASTSKKYDAIVCNPPYFSNSLHAKTESRTIARHTGTLSFEELTDGVAKLLDENGSYATILPVKECETFISIAKRYNLYTNRITQLKTNPSRSPKRILLQFSFNRRTPIENTLIIENEDHSYSDEYKELTREFYLAF